MTNEHEADTVVGEIVPMTQQEMSLAESQSRAEIDIQVATAHRYPRNPGNAFREALEIVQSNPSIAEMCFYTMPRAGKAIQGPSIRLAEIVINSWGNVRIQTRIVNIGPTTVTVQAQGIDLERNVGVSCEVQRRIMDKHGKRFNDDLIIVTANAAAAIAYRNVAFKLIPAVYVQPIYERAKEITLGNLDQLIERKKKAISFFAKGGILPDTLLKHLGRRTAADITQDDLEYLIGLVNAIKEGSANPDDIFAETRAGEPMNPEVDEDQMNGLAERMSAATKKTHGGKKKAKDVPEPEPDSPLPEPAQTIESMLLDIENAGNGMGLAEFDKAIDDAGIIDGDLIHASQEQLIALRDAVCGGAA